MTVLGDQLKKAIEAKSNDIKTFVWKLAKDENGNQQEIRLVDATEEQLNKFYKHCLSMLYSDNKLNPGRYELLKIIAEQRKKCNIELFLRKLEAGTICIDKRPYPRYLYIQDLRAYLNAHKAEFPSDQLKDMSIATCTGGLPREFERISIDDALNGGLDQLGYLDTKHITFSFILNMGVYLTPAEMKEFNEKDADGNPRSKLEQIKERLNIKNTVQLKVKTSGLNFEELRAMITLSPKKYSELTTNQLTILRDKVLFKLENEVMMHINQWEERMRQLKLVAESRGFTIKE